LAASKLYGIAYWAQLHSIQVLGSDGGGYLDDVTNGLNHILNHGQHPCVVSMSLGSDGSSQAMTNVINAIVAKGSLVIVAAGNDYLSDACNSFPANIPSVIAVGATDSDDNIAFFSNVGRCVKIWAPGIVLEIV